MKKKKKSVTYKIYSKIGKKRADINRKKGKMDRKVDAK